VTTGVLRGETIRLSFGMLCGRGGVCLRAEQARHQTDGDETGDDTGCQEEIEETDHEHVGLPFAS